MEWWAILFVGIVVIVSVPGIFSIAYDTAMTICSIDEMLYESLRSSIDDQWAVGAFDLIQQGESLSNDDIKWLKEHPEKAVRNLIGKMACSFI